MKIPVVISTVIFTFIVLFSSACQHPGESHPRIYISESSRNDFLKSMDRVAWKEELVLEKKLNLEQYLELCETDPEWLVSRLQMNWKTRHSHVYLLGGDFSHSDGEAPVPTVRFSGTRDWATDYLLPSLEEVEPFFDDPRGMYLENGSTGEWEWVHPSETGHIIEGINRKVLKLVQDAAFLYWLTGENKYADFAAPVFFKYIDGMYYRDVPEVLDQSSQKGLTGLATFEVIHEQAVIFLTIAYDFLHEYFVDQNMDLDRTGAVFQKWGDQIIRNGVPENNWNLFQARFLTYLALALEDDEHYSNGKGRQYYLKHTFEESTTRQIALEESLLVYDQENYIWPESPSYSTHVNTTLLRILTLLDNVSNEDELAVYPVVEKAALASFQYLFPNGYTIGFGDSRHVCIPPENFELLISNYRKYGKQEKENQITGLLNELVERGDYKREGHNLFQLFFYVDSIESSPQEGGGKDLITPTFHAPNVSMFIQRLGKGDQAMMTSTVGSFGNHAHANGISMELFACKYALAPDMGKGPSYWHPYHREYYARMPAHNTVVVDGISDYASMRSYHPFTLENHYPESGDADPAFREITFSLASFMEPKTKSDQQRLTSMVSTPSGQGYILDIFRSKKQNPSSQIHDYFYHNIGQTMQLLDQQDNEIILNSSNELGSHYGYMKAYDYLKQEKSASSDLGLKAIFRMSSPSQADVLMKLWIKGSPGQKIYSLMAPKSNALSKGTAPAELLDQEIPTLVLRRNAEAWSNPFVVVYNPSFEKGMNPVSKVEFRQTSDNSEAQVIHVDHSGGQIRDIIVANASENGISSGPGQYQKGLFSVTRLNENESMPDFIFMSGMYKFEFDGWVITATKKPFTASIQKVKEGYAVQTNQAIVIRIPISDGFRPVKLGEREGLISRFNPEQIEFRIATPCRNAIISSK